MATIGRIAALLAVLIPALVLAQPVGHSYDSLDALAADSTLVVRGKLLSVVIQPIGSVGADWTEATFGVDEYLKGSGPAVLRFEIRGANNGDPKIHNMVGKKTPLLGFFSESVRFGSRVASRFPYAPRMGLFGGSFVDLSPNAGPQIMTLDYRAVEGPAAILAQAREAITRTDSGRYRIGAIRVPREKVPKGYEAPWVYLSTPSLIPADEVLRPDQSGRLNPAAQYDGRRILSARGKTALLWDALTGKLLQKFHGSLEDIQAVCFCPPEAYGPPSGAVLTGSGLPNGFLGLSKDNTIRQWNIETGAIEKSFGPLMGPIESLDYAPDGGRILSRSAESSDQNRFRQRLWETFGRTEVCLLPGYGVVFSPDGSMAASRGYPSLASVEFAGVWDMGCYLQLCTLPPDRTYSSLGFSRFGNRLVTTSVAGLGAFATEIWDAETGTKLLTLAGAKGRQAEFTRDCKKIVTAEHNGGIGIWDAETGKAIRSTSLPKAARSFLLSPDGTRCLAKWGTWSNFGDDEGATLLDVANGKPLLQIDANIGGLVGFSADGKTIFGFDTATMTSGTVWDAATGKVLRKVALEGV